MYIWKHTIYDVLPGKLFMTWLEYVLSSLNLICYNASSSSHLSCHITRSKLGFHIWQCVDDLPMRESAAMVLQSKANPCMRTVLTQRRILLPLCNSSEITCTELLFVSCILRISWRGHDPDPALYCLTIFTAFCHGLKLNDIQWVNNTAKYHVVQLLHVSLATIKSSLAPSPPGALLSL